MPPAPGSSQQPPSAPLTTFAAGKLVTLDEVRDAESRALLRGLGLTHGVVMLEQHSPEYGAERRRLRVVKYRGVKFRDYEAHGVSEY